jgi:hypothetical protein
MKTSVILTIFFFLSLSLSAAIINVPADQVTIQAAVNAASTGDEIVVANGTYNESVNLNLMGTPGNIIIRAANTGMATVNGGTGAAFYASSFTGDITIDGFTVDRDVLNGGTDDGVLNFVNITGLLTIRNNTFDPGHGYNGVHVVANGSVDMSALVEYNSGAVSAAGDNEDFFFAEIGGTATLNAVVSNNTFSGLEDDAIAFHTEGTATLNATVVGNDFSNFSASGGGIEFFNGSSTSTGATVNGYVEGNTISGIASGDAILLDVHGSNTTINFVIKNNTLINNTASSGTEGINMNSQSNSAGATVRLKIENNTINNIGGKGILLEAETKTTSAANSYHFVVDGNQVTSNGTSPAIGIEADDPDDNFSLCLEMRNNGVTSPTGNAYEILQGVLLHR